MRNPTHHLTNVDLIAKRGDCSICGTDIELDVKKNPPKGRTAVQRYCRQGRLEQRRERYKKKPNNYLWSKLGVTLEDVEKLKAAQNGLCAICRKNPATDLDHCHNSNKVRAVLCHGCNTGLGLFQDDSDILIRAAEYLTSHQNL